MLKDALSYTVPVSQKTVNLIDLSGEEDANSHESCETLAACHSPSGALPACSSSQIHSCHHERALDSNVVRSVSLSSGSVSCGVALLPAALPVAGVAGALGSSLGGPGVARGGRCSGCIGLGWKVGFLALRFSLMQPIHARDDLRCTAPGSANSCVDTGNLLPVQQSTSYNLDQVVAPPHSRRKVRTSPTIGKGTAALTEEMSPAPACWNVSSVSQHCA